MVPRRVSDVLYLHQRDASLHLLPAALNLLPFFLGLLLQTLFLLGLLLLPDLFAALLGRLVPEECGRNSVCLTLLSDFVITGKKSDCEIRRDAHFLRKTMAREALFPSPSSELSLPLSTVSEPQSSPSSSSSLEDDSSCDGTKQRPRLFGIVPGTITRQSGVSPQIL